MPKTYTYTKDELLELENAFGVLFRKVLMEPPSSPTSTIIAFDDFKTEFRKVVPNTLWKGPQDDD